MNIQAIINLFKKQAPPVKPIEVAYQYNEYFLLNVDDRVYIKLTDKGYKLLANIRTDERKNLVPFRAVTPDDIKRLADDEGYTAMSLVDFMMAFGRSISYDNGMDYFDPCIRIKSLTLHSL